MNWEQIANQFFQREFGDYKKKTAAGRRPDAVEFTTIDQDVKRRDLTINALFYDIDTKEVVDLVGGIEDLKNGVVRTVGSAEERFREDRLRILRAIRFAGRFGSDLDPAVDAALRKDSRLGGFEVVDLETGAQATSNISAERIRDEFIKGIISAKSVKHFQEMLNRYGLFDWIFKGMKYLTDFIEERDSIVLIAHLISPMMTLGGSTAIEKGLHNLKYTTDEIKAISFLNMLVQLKPETAVRLKRLQKNAGVSGEQIRKFAKIQGIEPKLIDVFLKFELSVTGQEIMNQGFSGKGIGAEIDKREKENFEKLLKGV